MGAPWHAAQEPADQRYQSAYLFGAICPARGKGAALSLPTLRLCSFISTSSAAMWRAARTPCCYSTGRLAHDRQAESAEKHHAAAAAVASPGTQPVYGWLLRVKGVGLDLVNRSVAAMYTASECATGSLRALMNIRLENRSHSIERARGASD
ncbi:hypothetical protein X738_32605 [Mesorhizobium sp. LNHC209A00]|nr:hypothetical protein X738_32605 [Mesorhizobium sp. LNHC209A00]